MAKPQPSQVPNLKGQMEAIGREIAKDLHNTLNEVFFNKGASPNEPGTPLAPTQAMVTADLTGKMGFEDLMGYAKQKAQEADHKMDRGNDGPDKEQGRGMGM